MDTQHKYEEYYIAFIDILGFQELSKTATCEDIYNIFKALKDNSHATLFYNSEDVPAFEHVQHYIMSDIIVLYIRTNIEEAFLALIGTCLRLQHSLLYQNNPILLRGGIAKGQLFIEGNIIYGKGLTEAYQIENTVSIYPRIVFSKALLLDAKQNNQSPKRKDWEGMFTRKDDDEFYFVHYLCTTYMRYFDDIPKCWHHALTRCQSILDSCFNQSIREKYIWLKNYIIKEAESMVYLLNGITGGKEFLAYWKIQENASSKEMRKLLSEISIVNGEEKK